MRYHRIRKVNYKVARECVAESVDLTLNIEKQIALIKMEMEEDNELDDITDRLEVEIQLHHSKYTHPHPRIHGTCKLARSHKGNQLTPGVV